MRTIKKQLAIDLNALMNGITDYLTLDWKISLRESTVVLTKKTSGARSTDLDVYQLDTYRYLYFLSPWDSYGFSSGTYDRSSVPCQGFLTTCQ